MKYKTVHLLLEDRNKKKRTFICNSLEDTSTSNISVLYCRSEVYEVHVSPFICNECSRLCKSKDNLLYHIRIHKAAKIFTETLDSATCFDCCNLERSLLGHKQRAIVPKYEYSIGDYTSELLAYGYLH